MKDLFGLLLVLALCLPAGGALANECPSLMAKIDEILADAEDIDEETQLMVSDLRQQGEEAHAAGDHDAATKALHEALFLLGEE